jgi:hypothetical protein
MLAGGVGGLAVADTAALQDAAVCRKCSMQVRMIGAQ